MNQNFGDVIRLHQLYPAQKLVGVLHVKCLHQTRVIKYGQGDRAGKGINLIKTVRFIPLTQSNKGALAAIYEFHLSYFKRL